MSLMIFDRLLAERHIGVVGVAGEDCLLPALSDCCLLVGDKLRQLQIATH